jgi:hypothetical protein
MTPEGRLKKKIHDHLRAMKNAGEPLWFVKIHGHQMQRKNLPDFIICYRGKFIGIELKVDAEVTVGQQLELRDIRNAEGVAKVARSLEEVLEILRAI